MERIFHEQRQKKNNNNEEEDNKTDELNIIKETGLGTNLR